LLFKKPSASCFLLFLSFYSFPPNSQGFPAAERGKKVAERSKKVTERSNKVAESTNNVAERSNKVAGTRKDSRTSGAVSRFYPITSFSLLLEEQTILRPNRNFIFQILFGNCEQDFYFEKRVRIGIVFIR